MTQDEFDAGWLGGKETSRLLDYTKEYCQGYGVDFGCELDPHPNAVVLVDSQNIVHNTYMGKDQPVPMGARPTEGSKFKYHVHIRNIENLFPDWEGESFDFTYSSHLLEHIKDPRAFLSECIRLTKKGGHIVVVGPHEDWYWPNGHPEANADHSRYNWALNQSRVSKWLTACASLRGEAVDIVSSTEIGWDEKNWSFLVVARKLKDGEKPQFSVDDSGVVQENHQLLPLAPRITGTS